MQNKEPTPGQQQEFWEGCGFEQLPYGNKDYHYEQTVKTMNWTHPLLEYGSIEFLPRIDLNNLFKYAVPKLYKDGQGGVEFRYYPGTLRCVLTTECEAGFEETQTSNKEFNPALALFWALDKARKEVK